MRICILNTKKTKLDTKKMMKTAILLIIILCFLGCSEDKKNNDLEYSSWKLKGLVENASSDTIIFTPKDCDQCYTLKFVREDFFSGFGAVNSISGNYFLEKGVIHFENCIYTEVGTIHKDEQHYFNIIQSNTRFKLEADTLRLYSNDNTTHLFFERK